MIVRLKVFRSSLRDLAASPQRLSRDSFAQAPISQRTTSDYIAPRILRAQKDWPSGSCNGFVLCGIPYRGRGALNATSIQPYEPASHFPLGAGHKGHREAPLLHLQLFKSSTRCSSVQLAIGLVLSTVSRLPENSNDPRIVQLRQPVERIPILWESTSSPRQIRVAATALR